MVGGLQALLRIWLGSFQLWPCWSDPSLSPQCSPTTLTHGVAEAAGSDGEDLKPGKDAARTAAAWHDSNKRVA